MKTPHQLEEWRTERGMTAHDVARQIQSSRAAVRRYELGRMPKQPFLDRLVILTDGAVDGNCWLGKEAADVVAARHPGA